MSESAGAATLYCDRKPLLGVAGNQLSHLVAAPTRGGQSIDLQQVIATEPRLNQGFVTFFTIFYLGVIAKPPVCQRPFFGDPFLRVSYQLMIPHRLRPVPTHTRDS